MLYLRALLKVLGWLLTPLVAWAASFGGAWIGALGASLLANASLAAGLTVLGGAVAAILATVAWMRLLRGSPRLQEALSVTAEGVPTVAITAVERIEAQVERLEEKIEDTIEESVARLRGEDR